MLVKRAGGGERSIDKLPVMDIHDRIARTPRLRIGFHKQFRAAFPAVAHLSADLKPVDMARERLAEDLSQLRNRLQHFDRIARSEEHTSELQSQFHLVCRLLLE